MSDVSPAPPRPKTSVRPAETPGTTGLMTLATGVVVVAALFIAREVLIPITLAVLLAFVLAPLVNLMRRNHFARVPAVLLAVVLALSVILGLAGVIGAQVAGLATALPSYADTIQDKVQALQGVTVGRLSGMLDRLAHQSASGRPAASSANGDPSAAREPAAADAPPKPIPVEIHQPAPSPSEMARRLLGPLISPLATAGIVFVVVVFILLQQEDLRDRLIRLFGARDLHRTITAMDDAASRLSRYFLTQLALNAAFGCVIGIGLFLIGIPSAALWGIVAALMRFVPYVGAFLSAALPMALGAAVDTGWSMAAWTGGLFLVSEMAMGQAVEPLVYGHSTGLSPISVVVSSIFWSWLWGPIGLILSMPLTLCLVVLGRHVDRLEFLDVLLGDRPALTPVESFYHRMLAGDLDEVQEAAEELLKDRSLSSYYDEVAVQGLRLAAVDVERGVLSLEQIVRIRTGIDDLLGELADQEDHDPDPSRAAPGGSSPDQARLPKRPAPDGLGTAMAPPAWREPSAVLCVSGRGELDDAASAMLAQLLRKHGLGTRVAPHAVAASRAALAALDPTGVRMVCLCYAGIDGNPSHLRYAVRRLRGRLPGVPILVGLWPDEIDGDERLRAAIGADHYATSLRDTVVACLDHARGDVAGVADGTLMEATPQESLPMALAGTD